MWKLGYKLDILSNLPNSPSYSMMDLNASTSEIIINKVTPAPTVLRLSPFIATAHFMEGGLIEREKHKLWS